MVARRRFASGVSLAALAFTLGVPQAARSAGFLGAPTTAAGSVTFSRATTGSETITVDSAQAIVIWSPTDAAVSTSSINFLPNGNSVDYVAGSGAANGYTILNRIVAFDPSRRIDFNGAVNSAAGGAVWFYAPGGILLGATANFNVGSLLLTANDPVVDAGGNFIQSGNRFSVASAAGSSRQVAIAAGARIRALNPDSYVVAVAPRISQGGSIQVDGSAALVSAEKADFTYNAGLFDISVTQGASFTDSLVHNGSTTGPASSGAGDYHRIYLVAVPKNNAITMFIGGGGTLGFDVAGAADVVGNAIVLSSGFNVSAVAGGNPFADAPLSATAANLTVDGGTYTSFVTARSAGNSFVASTARDTSFAAGLSLRGGIAAHVGARNAHVVTIHGDTSISADARFLSGQSGADRTAGMALLYADTGGSLKLLGDAQVSADGYGDANVGLGSTGGGTGGVAQIFAQSSGIVTIAGNVQLSADGFASNASSGALDGGNASGGRAILSAAGSGAVTVGGSANLSAQAAGGVNTGGGDRIGGIAIGGSGQILANAGSVTVAGAVEIDVTARGGDSVGLLGGTGHGGGAQVSATTGTISLGELALLSHGIGGSGYLGAGGGTGTGGTATVVGTSNGMIGIGGSLPLLSAYGIGGDGDEGNTPGGAGIGGTVQILANGGIIVFGGVDGSLSLDASGRGSSGSVGGAGTGGVAAISSSAGSFVTQLETVVDASATGGDANSGNSGAATAGVAAVSIATATTGTLDFGATQLLAHAHGGNTSESGSGNGGAATGGTISFQALASRLKVNGDLLLDTSATGGTGSNGGAAASGMQTLLARTATVDVLGELSGRNVAVGGAAGRGNGGDAIFNGSIGLSALSDTAGGSRFTAQSMRFDISSTGGRGGAGNAATTALVGGNGGLAEVAGVTILGDSLNGVLEAGNFTLVANALGGAGGNGGKNQGGLAGNGGIGGAASADLSQFGVRSGIGGTSTAGSATFADISATSTATGGAGGAGGLGLTGGRGGRGGDAFGGGLTLLVRGSTVTALDFVADGSGTGGAGGAGTSSGTGGRGGDGFGGAATILETPQFASANPATATVASFSGTAQGTGGQGGLRGGSGGNGTGGEASITLSFQADGAPATDSGTLTIEGEVSLAAQGIGGSSSGGSGGFGVGGVATVISAYGTMTLQDIVVASAGGLGGESVGGSGGAATGGTASLISTDGSTTVGGDLSLIADAAGGASSGDGGAANGGIVRLQGDLPGTSATVGGTTILSAAARGGDAASGGSATGGVIDVLATAGAGLTLADTFATATATGGNGDSGTGGSATGGSISLNSAGSLRIEGDAEIDVVARGGFSVDADGSGALGGKILVTAASGSLFVGGDLNLFADAYAGGVEGTGAGAAATGGTVALTALDASAVLTVVGSARAFAGGFGGFNFDNDGAGGLGTGGSVQAMTLGGTLGLGGLIFDALGSGGDGSTGGAGQGGNVVMTAQGGTLTVGGAAGLSASGGGGHGGIGSGGQGNGGAVGVRSAVGGSLVFGDLLLAAKGNGNDGGSGETDGSGGNGGSGFGGFATAFGGGSLTTGRLSLDVGADGGSGGVGDTGNGNGGNAQGGSATVGFADLAGPGGTLHLASLEVRASATGGDGGGNAVGGAARVVLFGGTMTVGGDIALAANARGGETDDAGGTLGNADAGIAFVNVGQVAGATTSLSARSLYAEAQAIGGQTRYGSVGLVANNATINLASVEAVTDGDLPFTATTMPSALVVRHGSIVVSGAVSLETPGLLTLGLDDGSITVAGSLDLVAGGVQAPSGAPPMFPGTISAGRIDVESATDLASFASFVSGSTLSLLAGGLLSVGNLGSPGRILIDAGGAVSIGNVFTGTGFDLVSESSLTAGDIRAEDDIFIDVAGNTLTGAISGADSVFVTGGGDVTTGAIDAGILYPSTASDARFGVLVRAAGSATTGRIDALGAVGVVASGGDIVAGAINAGLSVGLLAQGGVTAGLIHTGSAGTTLIAASSMASLLALDGNGGVDYAALLTATPVALGGSVQLAGVATGVFKSASLGDLIILGTTTAAQTVKLTGRSIGLLDVVAGSDIDITASQSLSAADLRSEATIDLLATRSIVTGNISAGDSIYLTALGTQGSGGNILTGAIDAGILRPAGADGGLLLVADGSATTGAITVQDSAGVVARRGSISVGAVDAQLALGLLAGTDVTAASIRTGTESLTLIAASSMAALIVEDSNGDADYSALLTAAPVKLAGNVVITGAVSTGVFRSASLGDLSIGGAVTASLGASLAGRVVGIHDIASGGRLNVAALGSLTAASVRSEDDVFLDAVGNIASSGVSAGDSIFITSTGGNVVTGALDAGILRPFGTGGGLLVDASGSATTGAIRAQGAAGVVARSGAIIVDTVDAPLAIGLLAGTDVTTAGLHTGGSGTILVAASSMASLLARSGNGDTDYSALLTATPVKLGGNILIGGPVSTGALKLASLGNLLVGGPIVASLSASVSGRDIALANLTSGGRIEVTATGALTTGNIRGEDDVDLDAAGNILTGGISAADSIFITATAGGNVVTGALDAGIVRPSTTDGGLLIDASGSATTGTITAQGAAGVVARSGAISVGAVDAGLAVGLLAGTNVSTGAVRTGAGGTTLIAASSMAALIVERPGDTADYSALLTATPVRLGGSVTLGGAVSTGSLKSAGSGGFTAQGIAAGTSVAIDSGGTAAFNGAVGAPVIAIRSGDIFIGPNGGLGSAATTLLTLTVDPAATSVTLGGAGATASEGWTLDAREAALLRSRRTVVATSGTAPPLVTIATLALRGSGNNSGRTATEFVVQSAGAIRVTGALTVADALAADLLQVSAGQRLEVVTDSGGALGLAATGGALAGRLSLSGSDVRVGDAALLTALAANPAAAGRDVLLAAVPATASLAGALGADRIDVQAQRSFVIRNQGDVTTRAGFSVGTGGLNVTSSGTTPLEVVINGRATTAAGLVLTNAATVAQVVVPAVTPASTLNGCAFTGGCSTVTEAEVAQMAQVIEVVAVIATEVVALDTDEQLEREKAATVAEKLPGVRIARLIDLSSVAAAPLIDEAITSSGNSSLWRGNLPPTPAATNPGGSK